MVAITLQVDPESLSRMDRGINITAQDPIRLTPLSFEDLDRKLFGLQYHPESFYQTRNPDYI